MTKRPLVAMALFFIAGIAAAVLDIELLPMLMLGIVSVWWTLMYRRKMLGILLLALFCMVCGMLRMTAAENLRTSIGLKYASRVYDGELLVTSFSDGGKADAEFFDEGKRVKVYLSVEDSVHLYPGDIIWAKVTLREVSRSKSSKADFGAYLAGKGTYLYAKAEKVSLAGQYTQGLRGKIFSVRRYINEVGEKSFSGDIRALFNAMVLGDKSLISTELSAALQGAGLNHIAVVSGMHLSIMIAAQMLLINKLFGKRRIGSALTVAGALFITFVTGAGASVVRACIMCIVYQLSRVCYRENDALSSLSLALLTMAVFNPYIVLNAGLVLSALSVFGIVVYNQKILAVFSRLMPETAANAAAVSVSAQLAVCPAVIYYFGIITPYSIIANLFVFPFATAIVPLGMAYVLLYNIPYIADAVKLVTKFLAEAIEAVCIYVSDLPGAITDIGTLSVPLFTAWVFMLAAIYLYPKQVKKIGAVGAVFVLVLCTLVTMDGAKREGMRMNFLNYGSGSSVIVSPEEGEVILIGCEDSYDVEELAKNKGIKKLECGVLTDTDYEEMLIMARNGSINTLVIPKEIYTREDLEKITAELKICNVRAVILEGTQSIDIGGAIIDYPALSVKSTDAAAVGIEYEGKRFISLQSYPSADIEKLLREGVSIDCDVLKLPFTILHKKTDVKELTYGKILQTEKEFSIKE